MEDEKKKVTIHYKKRKELTSEQNKQPSTAISELTNKQKSVIDTALSYLGTPYRYGGTNRKGMDCSGLVGVSFQKANISLSRSANEMAKQGEEVKLKNAQIGDLIFFSTGKNNRISHVGIVVETGESIKFIHSSTSRGVIISSLNESYWKKAYRKIKRVM